ncbi:hypothetical protein Zm00014a_030545 [Zea mays]|uniref:Uncharacterized protein n=2 Tax=Zea mays TaxID=4577 RepID=A0A3L6DBJ9_MAIZE|nr:hypothetical protein Zm00014a_030545 [Zea mays]
MPDLSLCRIHRRGLTHGRLPDPGEPRRHPHRRALVGLPVAAPRIGIVHRRCVRVLPGLRHSGLPNPVEPRRHPHCRALAGLPVVAPRSAPSAINASGSSSPTSAHSRTSFPAPTPRTLLASRSEEYMLLFRLPPDKNNPDAKGLYGVSFPYYDELSMVYSKDMATGEGAEDMTDAVKNLEEELVCVNANDEEVGEDMTFVETPRRYVDSTSSSSKKRKKEWKGMKTASSDPLLDVFNEVSGDLKVATMSIGKMAQAMDREASNQEKARDEDPQQKLREKAINEV